MTTTYGTSAAGIVPDTRWRTRDIVVAAVIGVAFGVVFWAWNLAYAAAEPVFAAAPPLRDLMYGVWLMPAILAPLVIRKPGAALFAEMVAAGVSALLGSQWSVDTLLSGFLQGAAAELVFAFTLYRSYGLITLGHRRARECGRRVRPRLGPVLPDDLERHPGRSPRCDGCVGGGHRGGWLASVVPLAARDRRAGRVPRLTTTGIRVRDLEIAYRGASRPGHSRAFVRRPRRRMPARRRRVGVRQEFARSCRRRSDPTRLPGTVAGDLTVAGVDPRVAERGEVARHVGLVFQDPGSQLVMERVEDEVAFGLENRDWPLDAMRVRVREAIAEAGLGGSRAPSDEPLVGWPAAAARARRGAGRAARDRRPRRTDGEPRSAWGSRLLRPTPGAGEKRIDHDRAHRASRRRRLGAGRPRPCARTRWRADRRRHAGRGARSVAAADVGIGHLASARHGDGDREPEPTSFPLPGAPSERSVAVASGVGFEYERGAPVLEAIDLALGAGERVALVGANGSGKSTLGRLLVGVLRPSRGEVRLAGRDPATLPASDLARRAGYVFQDPEAGFLTNSVGDEVMLGLEPAERAAAPALMARLRLPLETFATRSPYRLSGGEARRLSLACTLVRRPGFLVLDEPTFGQDRLGYEGLLEILRERLDDGVCLVAATHDRRLVADIASRVVEIEAGRIVSDKDVMSTAA